VSDEVIEVFPPSEDVIRFHADIEYFQHLLVVSVLGIPRKPYEDFLARAREPWMVTQHGGRGRDDR
jgi:hypothetical protein